ncbi:MAG: hypothetical protein ACXV3U_08280 [Halobacteriota archaeon]
MDQLHGLALHRVHALPDGASVRYSYWISAAVYAASVAAVGSVLALLWQYAAHHYRLIDRTLSPRDIHMSTVRSLVTPSVFLLSIPAAYLNLRFAPYIWLSSFAIRRAIYRGESAALQIEA